MLPIYNIPITHSNLNTIESQVDEPPEDITDEHLQAIAAIKEVFNSYGLYNEIFLPKIKFGFISDRSIGTYYSNKHIVKIDLEKTDDLTRVSKHEGVHAALAVLRQKIIYDNHELFKRKVIDGLIKVFKNPPGGFFLTKNYKIIRSDLDVCILENVKELLLHSKINAFDQKLVAKDLQRIGLQAEEANYMAYLLAVSLCPIQMTKEFEQEVNFLNLTKRQFDLALRSAEDLPLLTTTTRKDDYISNPPNINFFNKWFSSISWRIWKHDLLSTESKNKSYKEYLKSLEEILARLAEIPVSNTKNKLCGLSNIYRSKSNPNSRLRLIEKATAHLELIEMSEELKKQFKLLIEKLTEDTSKEIEQITLHQNF